jgi:beta-phosphoglucomutase family hydrolase
MPARLVTFTLPTRIRACLFDLDGVLTQTAKVHEAAWKQMFDAYLEDRSRQTRELFRAFVLPDDYARYIDGKLRQDGVRSFLESRGIALPEGTPEDPPSADTVFGLGNRKNVLFLEVIRDRGVERYPESLQFVEGLRAAGYFRAVVSASQNCADVLVGAGLDGLFDVRVDGLTARSKGLRGKPAPDMFLAAAQELGVPPAECVVFEDAEAGVAAGRAGGFGWVVGVDRVGHAEALRTNGADTVVNDLSELEVA